MIEKWDRRFLRLAREVSSWSKDPRTRVGAVAVRDRVILSTGFNGMPRGMSDTPERLEDREFKLAHTIHAEQNCIYNAGRIGARLEGSDLFVYGLPICSDCAKAAVQAQVSRVVMCQETFSDRPEWERSYEVSRAMFDEVGVGAVRYMASDIS